MTTKQKQELGEEYRRFLSDIYLIQEVQELEIKGGWIFVTYINSDMGMLYPQQRGIEYKEFLNWQDHNEDFRPIDFVNAEEVL